MLVSRDNTAMLTAKTVSIIFMKKIQKPNVALLSFNSTWAKGSNSLSMKRVEPTYSSSSFGFCCCCFYARIMTTMQR